MNSRRIFVLILALGLDLAAAGIAYADDSDPPARVARINLLEGSAALRPAGSAAWLEDLVNRPLGSGDKLICDSGSRAELHVGSTAIRLGAQTALQIINIGDKIVQLGLSSGTLIMRVRNLAPNDAVEVDTPNVAVTVLAAGDYRIDANATGDVVDVAVISGYAEVTGQTQDFTLNAQQQGEFSGADTLAVNFGDLAPADSFDEWAAARDAREEESLSSNYVSPEATGYEDLDDNGTWQEMPEYGMVWQPQVSVGWAPYQVGRWAWIRPWGWTWIDAAAWGYAPFHYGRWVYVNSAWRWAPGNRGLPQVYAPALVAWLGGPNVAWVALAYGEPFQPSYRASAAYVRRLNAASGLPGAPGAGAPGAVVRGKGRQFANQAIPGAVSAATPETFASGRPLHANLIRLDARSAALFAHGLVARTAAHDAPMHGASPSPVNLIPAQAVALQPRREFVSPAGAAETRVEREGSAPQSESRSRAPAAGPAASRIPGAESIQQKPAAKSAAAPKEPRKAKPEPR